MRRAPCSALVCVLAALVCAASAHADEEVERGRGWWGDLDRGEIVDLADVVAEPRRYTGREITFFAILRGPDDVFVPQGTIFSRRTFSNLSVWPDGAPLWEQRAYQREEFPFLYIRRTHVQRDALVQLPRFTRIEVTGRIRSILRDHPFIEVTSWRETSHRLGREVVDAMAWGDVYARGGKIELAAAKYKEALAVDLPPLYDMAIRKRTADALRELGYPDYAAEIESGETLGGTGLPEAVAPAGTPDAPLPGHDGTAPAHPPAGFAPVTEGGAPPRSPPRRPEAAGAPTPAAEGARDPANPFFSPDEDLPGQPVNTGRRPQRRPQRRAAPNAPSAPSAPSPEAGAESASPPGNPFLTGDLPGVPMGKTPAGGFPPVREPALESAPATAGDGATEAAEVSAPAPPRARPRRPVLPPSRDPRLVGVR